MSGTSYFLFCYRVGAMGKVKFSLKQLQVAMFPILPEETRLY